MEPSIETAAFEASTVERAVAVERRAALELPALRMARDARSAVPPVGMPGRCGGQQDHDTGKSDR
jgi:hypothetical protein